MRGVEQQLQTTSLSMMYDDGNDEPSERTGVEQVHWDAAEQTERDTVPSFELEPRTRSGLARK
eukprot:COSAG02_NODE_2662_length_8303_cov_7.299976_7_plen_63_part_00